MYDPRIHHRRSIRLKGYDYSQEGLYFVTICIQHRECLLGEIVDKRMLLNDAGQMVEKWYAELENKYPDIQCGEWVVMPNHFHCILKNWGTSKPVGADLRVCPNPPPKTQTESNPIDPVLGEQPVLGEHIGSPLHRVIQWFKTMTTNEYIRNVKMNNWPPFPGKLWQRDYWEHIIRNEKSHQRISAYIINNPQNWDTDSINPINIQ